MMLPNRIESSRGVQTEIARAKELGIPVFYSREEMWEYEHGLSEVFRG